MKYIFQDEDSISIYKGTPEEINELIRLLAVEDETCECANNKKDPIKSL